MNAMIHAAEYASLEGRLELVERELFMLATQHCRYGAHLDDLEVLRRAAVHCMMQLDDLIAYDEIIC